MEKNIKKQIREHPSEKGNQKPKTFYNHLFKKKKKTYIM